MSEDLVDLFQARYYRELDADERGRVGALIEDVLVLIAVEAGIEDVPEPLPAVLGPVVYTATRRSFDNPMGLSSETIGSYTWRADASDGVYLTEPEVRLVRRWAKKKNLVSVRVSHPFGFHGEWYGPLPQEW